MKRNLLHIGAVFLMALCTLPALAQIGNDGYYRARNADNNGTEYISIANDFFNFSTVISNGAGATYVTGRGLPYAIISTKMFLRNDIHLINNESQIISPAEVIYFDKKNTNASNHDYNLIAQGTSLLTLTTGRHVAGGYLSIYFRDVYANITSTDGTNTANTQYIASVPLKGYSSQTGTSVYANLGSFYLVDSAGVFNINEFSSNLNAKWYIQPITYFNVQPDLEFHGKYYTTLYVPFSCTLGENINKAYVIHQVSSGSLVYEAIASSGDSIPAGTPVILECNSSSAVDCKLFLNNAKKPIFTAPDVTKQSGSPRADETTSYYSGTNLLKGTYYCNTDGTITYTYLKRTQSGLSYTFSEAQTSLKGNHYTTYNKTYNISTTTTKQKYILGINANGNLGFIQATSTNPAPSGILPANTAWMVDEGDFSVAKPTFDPTAGTKNNPLYVTINCATPGATIYYTTDGSDPTTSETRQEYTGPVYVEKTTTIKAVAYKEEPLYNNYYSAVASAKYTLKVATPTFNPPAGNYSSPQSVTINSATEGATIYYTLDGSAPTNKKTLYTGPITVDHDMTIKAIAYKSPMSTSDVGTAAYTFPKITASPSALTINEEGGNFTITGRDLITNVSVTPSTDFSTAIESEVNTIEPWGFVSNEGSVDGTVNVTYQGRSLNTQGTIVLATEGLNISVPVTYIPDIYIVTDNGVTDQWNFNGAMMTNNNGIYTATFNAPADNTFILFARKASLGENERWGTRYVFGPNSGGDWVMPYNVETANGNIDVSDDDPIKFTQAGTYFITIDATDANNPTFSIVRVPEKTLAEIESTGTVRSCYVVSNELIGTWAYGTILWAKDYNSYEGYTVNDTRPAKTSEQEDHLRTHKMHHGTGTWIMQNREWDESNWVALDFSGLTDKHASDYVGKKINGVKGIYADNVNYKITLTDIADPIDDPTLEYPTDLTNNKPGVQDYFWPFNSYMPSNFYGEHDAVNNQNHTVIENGVERVVGFLTDSINGEKSFNMYFMNPKIQEVARIWGAWNGTNFTVYTNQGYNDYTPYIDGAVSANWNYNTSGNITAELVPGTPYVFHAVVFKRVNNKAGLRAPYPDPVPSTAQPAADYVIYPLDFQSHESNYTALGELSFNAIKQVESVRYYNVMGMESKQPFEGINIVVTRYTDGTTSTMKVIR